MRFLRSSVWLVFFVSCCFTALPATINVPSMSRADMVNAISAAADGDILVFPAGTADYASSVTLDKALTLKFVEHQSIIKNTSGGQNTWVIVVNTGKRDSAIRITGLTVFGNGSASGILVERSQKNVRIDNCHFTDMRRHAVQFVRYESYGLVDHCTFTNCYTAI